jgi:hypothetical protein
MEQSLESATYLALPAQHWQACNTTNYEGQLNLLLSHQMQDNEQQTYLVTNQLLSSHTFHQPITPVAIHTDRIITKNKPYSTYQPPSLQQNPTASIDISLPIRGTLQRHSGKLLIVGIHCTVQYDYQKFSWTLADEHTRSSVMAIYNISDLGHLHQFVEDW